MIKVPDDGMQREFMRIETKQQIKFCKVDFPIQQRLQQEMPALWQNTQDRPRCSPCFLQVGLRKTLETHYQSVQTVWTQEEEDLIHHSQNFMWVKGVALSEMTGSSALTV